MRKIILLAPAILLSGCVKIPVLNVELKPQEICLTDKCNPGSVGEVFIFDKEPYSPDVDKDTTIDKIALSIVGHTIKNKDDGGDIFKPCSINSLTGPFTSKDIQYKGNFGLNGNEISYSLEKKLNLDVSATVSATIDDIKKQFDISKSVADLSAELSAGYQKINNSNSSLTGTYYELGLRNKIVNTIDRDPQYKECVDYLKEKDRLLITAIGVINYKTEVKNNEYDKFIAKFNALLKAKGVNYNAAPSINRQVTKQFSSKVKNGYQVVVWRRANTQQLDL